MIYNINIAIPYGVFVLNRYALPTFRTAYVVWITIITTVVTFRAKAAGCV